MCREAIGRGKREKQHFSAEENPEYVETPSPPVTPDTRDPHLDDPDAGDVDDPGDVGEGEGEVHLPEGEAEIGTEPEQPEDRSATIPHEYRCPLCGSPMQDAVIVPCCGQSFCDSCIRPYLEVLSLLSSLSIPILF